MTVKKEKNKNKPHSYCIRSWDGEEIVLIPFFSGGKEPVIV